jgi:Ala-tRNA(Pro) deacylase
MSSVAEKLREYFDDHGVGYRIIVHEAAASAHEYHAILGTRYEQMPKAIFLHYQGKDGKGFAILALQAHKRADLERVRRVLHAHDVRLGFGLIGRFSGAGHLRPVATGCNHGAP